MNSSRERVLGGKTIVQTESTCSGSYSLAESCQHMGMSLGRAEYVGSTMEVEDHSFAARSWVWVLGVVQGLDPFTFERVGAIVINRSNLFRHIGNRGIGTSFRME